ncbi:type I polyketide synthase, partial [Streptomyces iconiensis]
MPNDHTTADGKSTRPATLGDPGNRPGDPPSPALGAAGPIAVIGLACRLPKAPDVAAFGRLLALGEHAVGEPPAGRWAEDAPRFGAFLDEVDRFDAAFFGVSPREAEAMDPQQRLMLELGWEALEEAGIVPARLAGSRTSVFASAIWDDYAALHHRRGRSPSRYAVTGLHRSLLANRLSYALGLTGPSMTVDTAQSSSLVAVHLACESLRRGETDLAVVGGVNLILSPDSSERSAGFGALSPDGRCFTFDERANGYVRGEGGAAVVLKPLEHARADGDRVHCVILGSAVNNDGASQGLTVPDRAAQEAVLRAAHARAGTSPRSVGYVELHGTGTPVGDPVEAAALGAVLGHDRPAGSPLLVGSAKTNVGHLEGAAGLVGLVKTALSIARRKLPPSLNFRSPHPDIPLTELGLRVVTEETPWPVPAGGQEAGGELIAGVSSFGMGGTNCHMVLAGPADEPAPEPSANDLAEVGSTVLWPVSGRGRAALREQAARLLGHLVSVEGAATRPSDTAYSLATTRTHFEDRAVVLGDGRDQALEALDALTQGREHPALIQTTTPPTPTPRTAFLFTGQGSQHPQMGRELYDTYPHFAHALNHTCDALDPHLPHPLRDILFAPPHTEKAALLNQTQYTQPALFALETALHHLLTHWGIHPHYLTGHSIGELTAAHTAGVLNLTDAATLVTTRARLMQTAPTGGTMIAIEATEEETLPLLTPNLTIAAINTPHSLVISGNTDEAHHLAHTLTTQGRKTKQLTVSHAFHSPHMDPILNEFHQTATTLTYHPPHTPIISNLTGTLATTEQLTNPTYWTQHIRHPVRFNDTIQTLHNHHTTTLIELGPDAALTGMARDSLQESGQALLASMRRGRPEPSTLLAAVAGAHTHGTPVDWSNIPEVGRGRAVALPTYAFQRERHWLDTRSETSAPAAGPDSDSDTAPRTDTAPPAAAHSTEGPQSLAATPTDLLDLVLAQVAIVLGHVTADSVDADHAFKDLGFDSLSGVELRDRLQTATGLSLPSALVYNHPTPTAVVRLLRERLSGEGRTDAGPIPGRPVPAADDPIAIVGMACRYPGGVASPEDLWSLVRSGTDAIGPFPTDRGWDLAALYDPDPAVPGTTYVREGGFLAAAGDFDPAAFGISPREATAMDPQQRLLLETSWEALEHAGIAPDSLRGSLSGVFVGCTAQDYGPRLDEAADGFDGYLLTGGTTSVASGRLAYTFGFEGPAVTVDTACSSSLVALHLAAQALRQGDCDMALVGGATVMATPGMFLEFSRQRGLAPDARCKPFAAAADGTAWSEGVAMLLVERLSHARRNGHRVLATVRGSAINQDGASNGLTAPSGPSQERVIRQALANAGLTAPEVDAMEAHGTGTRLGDPIEAEALLATYGSDRPAGQPLRVGSLKSNIGHAQAAAGVGGVIKMVMAMRDGLLPRTLHVDEPTPHVDWSTGAVSLLTEEAEWPDNGQPRRAAVSSFGISGTNAHVILEEADEPSAERREPAAAPRLWPLSGHSEDALREQARRLGAYVRRHPGTESAAVGGALAAGRAVLDHRAVVLGDERDQALEALDALTQGREHPALIQTTTPPTPTPRTAFLFTGQGSQHPQMGRELYDTYPHFAHALNHTCDALDPHLPHPLRDILFAPPHTEKAALLNQTQYTQPALFALETALHHLLTHWGIHPHYLTGHSIGELTAAHTAGVLNLTDAATLVTTRARLMQTAPTGGTMIAIEATEEETLPLLTPNLTLADINTPHSLVISGNTDEAHHLAHTLTTQGRKTKQLTVSHAFHSPHMDPILNEFHQTATTLTYHPPHTPIISNLTGTLATTEQLTNPTYWTQHIRHPVRFNDTIQTLHNHHTTTLIELGPDAALTALVAGAVPVLRKGRPAVKTLATALATACAQGAELDHETMLGQPGTPVDLPTYGFQRQRYWMLPPSRSSGPGALGLEAAGHPVLVASVELAEDGGMLLTGVISPDTQPWTADHEILGTVLLPGTAFLEFALKAGEHAGTPRVEELTLEAPLILSADAGPLDLQLSVGPPAPDGTRACAVHSRPVREHGEWLRHASGLLSPASEAAHTTTEPAAWPPSGAEPITPDALYSRLSDLGYSYGPGFRCALSAWRRGEELFAGLTLPEELRSPDGEAGADEFLLHPALLDAALHPLVMREATETDRPLPFVWSGVELWATGARTLRVRWAPATSGGTALSASDEAGRPVLTAESLVLRPLAAESLGTHGPTGQLHRVSWRTPAPTTGSGGPATPPAGPLPQDTALAPDDCAVRALLEGTGEGRSVASLVAVPVPAGRQATAFVLRLMREWLDDERSADARLVFLTRGAVAAVEEDAVTDPWSSAVWGLVRSARAEHPTRFAVADLDEFAAAGPDAAAAGPDGTEPTPSAGSGTDQAPCPDSGALAALPLLAAYVAAEPELAVRAGNLLVPRLVLATSATGPAAPMPPDSAGSSRYTDRTVLVTGGTGGLGRRVVRHLVERHGARHLLLLSRSGEQAPGAAALARDMSELGAEIRFVSCDTADRDALARVLGSVPDRQPLGAVFHLAGVLDDGTVAALSTERLDTVLRPKADTACHLHELTRERTPALDDFVLFSSVTGITGTAGQGNYAAANAYLDGLAQERHALGLPATSLAWGLWTEADGMAGGLSATEQARWSRSGIAPLAVQPSLDLLDAALAAPDEPALVPVRVNPGALGVRAETESLPPVLRDLVRVRRPRAGSTDERGGTDGSWAQLTAALSAAEQNRAAEELVRTTVAAVLGHAAPSAIDTGRAFKELGFDSLTGVELRNRLSTATGLRLPATTVFDHPTAASLSAYLLSLLPGAAHADGHAIPTGTAGAADSADPVVIVGMACRYPGSVASPKDLWDLVASGSDAIGPFPANRGWDLDGLYDPDPERTGKSYAREGGFLYEAGDFDAEFFGISPREAMATDPQQRLLLETAWETFEQAGIDPGTVRGSRTGVFAGVMYSDYGSGLLQAPEELEGYLLTGNTSSVISGRLSYTFDLEGPAVTVDTACSSSLVALHLAAQALRSGECDLALAGGVTVMARPDTFVEFSRQRGLSPDGRCKAFAAAADGTGWSEGAGLLLVERLSDARRNGHQILAVVRGTAVNQDGASNGLTAPNGPSQQRVIRQALHNAGLDPADIDTVEAHGTGTKLGDPIEAQALLATYGQDRPAEEPLYLGSLKSNIGHTQAAAGVAGIIKMIMAMRHELLPRTLHIDEPTPHVDWESGAVQLLDEAREWPRNGHPRRAAVSSFGISGTNAHVVLEEAPNQPEPISGEALDRPEPTADEASDRSESAPAVTPLTPWPLSGHTEQALRDQARRLSSFLCESPDAPPAAIGHALATGRAALGHRAVVLPADPDEALRALTALAEGREDPAVVRGSAENTGGTAFLFTGQGSQRPGMGAQLHAAHPVFATAFDNACAALDPHLDRPLRDIVLAAPDTEEATLLNETQYTQPALFAHETALYQLLQHHGVTPDFVAGHSLGEVTAAHVAGVLSLEDAALLVAVRGRLMQAARCGGAMIAVEASEDEMVPRLTGGVSLAALNSTTSLVISGDPEAAHGIARSFAEQGRRTRPLNVSHAFHSPHMDSVLDEFQAAVATLEFHPPHTPVISNVTGALATAEELMDPGYWARHIRLPVRFHDTVRALQEEHGVSTLLEVGPDAALAALVPDVIPSLRRGHDERHGFLTALARLQVLGVPVDWRLFYPGAYDRVELPSYAFQHSGYWLDPYAPTPPGTGPVLGVPTELAEDGGLLFAGTVGTDTVPWLADHTVGGVTLAPGSFLVGLALDAGAHAGCPVVDELTLEAPLVLPAEGAVPVQVTVGGPAEDGRRTLAVHARGARDERWVRHAVGALAPAGAAPAATADSVWPPDGATPADPESVYARLAALGYGYGPAFRNLSAVWRAGETLFAEVRLSGDTSAADDRFALHPALLDAALHLLPLEGEEAVRLPFSWTGVRLHASGATELRVRLEPLSAHTTAIVLTDTTGQLVGSVDSLALRTPPEGALEAASATSGKPLYQVRWVAPSTPSPDTDEASWCAFEDLAGDTAVPPFAVARIGPSGSARAAARHALALAQEWVADERYADSCLAVVTSGALAAVPGEAVRDLPAASVWGLVRSAQSEHPGRFVLIDTDDTTESHTALNTALNTNEPQLALRNGHILLPRLTPPPTPTPATGPGTET